MHKTFVDILVKDIESIQPMVLVKHLLEMLLVRVVKRGCMIYLKQFVLGGQILRTAVGKIGIVTKLEIVSADSPQQNVNDSKDSLMGGQKESLILNDTSV